jgi:tRNA (guanine10-N2)-dimethyltransferase
LAALASERVEVRTASFDNQVLRIDAVGPVERAVHRLGLAHLVSEELASGDFEAIRAFAQESDLHGQTFRVRSRGLGIDVDPLAVEGPLGADFGRTGRVDLDQPVVDYRLLVGEDFLLGRVIHRVDRARLEATKVAHRSFSLPISLHPKFARTLVNLARVPMAGTVLDPFCGTGGVLLEACAIGLRPIGLDSDRRMVFGCRSSLHNVQAEGRLGIADAGQLPLRMGSVHGIATDPPYGRAASTRGESIKSLYRRAFRAFRDLLPSGAHIAVVLPNEGMIDLASEHFELIETHALRVHRSLVRHFCVFVSS